ncbi:MAG: hypothetical protein ACR2QE_10025 [Acidimicrobiales bacterium]
MFDIDGVLADATHRQHLLDGWGDWDSFFAACGDDDLLRDQAVLTGALRSEWLVVLLTSRPMWVQRQTRGWLERHAADIEWDLLIMRPDRDWRSSANFKRDEVRALDAAGYEVTLTLDDDRRNVAAFRNEGLACIYIHSGYHD